jgi:hypothetical protein
VQTHLAPQPVAEALRAPAGISPEEQLTLAVQAFDPGLYVVADSTPTSESLFSEVRRAEARYLPVELKAVLEESGYWSSVRVLPQGVRGGDVILSGRIVVSTGKELELEMKAVDATGELWLDKQYLESADITAYFGGLDENETAHDPFRRLYVEIANDLASTLRKRSAEELNEIRRVSTLRLGAELAPAVYDPFLDRSGRGRWRLAAMPAAEERWLPRLAAAQRQDDEILSRLDGHYGGFHDEMKAPYDDWRAYSYGEQVAFEQLRRSGQIRKTLGVLAILGALVMDVDDWDDAALRDVAFYSGIAAFESGMAKSAEALGHLANLRQLGAGFESEMAPMGVEVEGEMVELRGSAEAQFTGWRQSLQRAWSGVEAEAKVELEAASPERIGEE